MSPKSITPRHSIDSCLFHLNSWKPFSNPNSQTLDSDHNPNPNPNPNSIGINSKRPCLSDRSTSLFSLSIDAIDFSKLSLFDEPRTNNNHHNHQSRLEKLRWSIAKKRRRKCGSRSVSGKSSDRSVTGTRNNGGYRSVYSDAMGVNGGTGTDSSGELFGNNVNGWASDVSEVRNGKENGNVGGEVGGGFGFEGGGGGSESGYGSEPGYRGDVELGYGGDEFDDEEDEGARLLMLWGQTLGGTFLVGFRVYFVVVF